MGLMEFMRMRDFFIMHMPSFYLFYVYVVCFFICRIFFN